MGDVIHSTPIAVTKQQSTPPYQLLAGSEGSTFNTFLESKQTRRDMVYVGANDGMLHGFRTDTGVEEFAFVPQATFANLADLMSTSYGHTFYVDGSLQAADAYINSAWKSVLVGGTGRGGNALFGLDVSTPTSFNANNVLWEYTHAELGLVLGKAQIVRLNNGVWAAVSGNGYNSASEQAQLFIINLATGALIKKFDTGVGSENGLATPLLVDTNGDFSYDYAYAGDLQGNVWKFDLTDSDPANWSIALSGNPLYTAVAPSGNRQPITSKPAIVVHPLSGYVILFEYRSLLRLWRRHRQRSGRSGHLLRHLGCRLGGNHGRLAIAAREWHPADDRPAAARDHRGRHRRLRLEPAIHPHLDAELRRLQHPERVVPRFRLARERRRGRTHHR